MRLGRLANHHAAVRSERECLLGGGGDPAAATTAAVTGDWLVPSDCAAVTQRRARVALTAAAAREPSAVGFARPPRPTADCRRWEPPPGSGLVAETPCGRGVLIDTEHLPPASEFNAPVLHAAIRELHGYALFGAASGWPPGDFHQTPFR